MPDARRHRQRWRSWLFSCCGLTGVHPYVTDDQSQPDRRHTAFTAATRVGCSCRCSCRCSFTLFYNSFSFLLLYCVFLHVKLHSEFYKCCPDVHRVIYLVWMFTFPNAPCNRNYNTILAITLEVSEFLMKAGKRQQFSLYFIYKPYSLDALRSCGNQKWHQNTKTMKKNILCLKDDKD